jgi:RND family efflux transporter MFP subunit
MKTQYRKPAIDITRKAYKAIALLFLAAPAFIFMGCQQESTPNAEAIRTQISEYNQQIVELNQKISTLEQDLEALGETSANRERTSVTVSEIARQPFDNFINVSASVEAIQAAMISPETNGQIREINVVKGQKVSRGQQLARLNTTVIETNISELKTSLQLAETVYKRQQRLWEQEIGSEIQYLEAKNNFESLQSRLESLEAQLNLAVMRAPFDGIVDEIFAKRGELAMPGSMVMQIINLDQLYINADVSESFLPSVDSQENVILRFPAYPDYEEEVPIFRLGNVINPENRTFRLQLKINNRDGKFKPNMVANVGLKTFSTQEALVVPSIIIKQDVQGFYLFLAQENGDGDFVAKKVYVERGPSGEGNTMIASGIEAGDLLITSGHNQVNDGTLISFTNDMAGL